MTVTPLKRPEGSRIVRSDRRYATLDIERHRGWARVQMGQFTIEGPFWDLWDEQWKRRLGGRGIKPAEVVRWPSLLSYAFRTYGEEQVHNRAVWDRGGHEAMVRALWRVIDSHDAIIGHNIKRFDMPKIYAEFALLGMTPPSPVETIDTLTIARRVWGFESKQLGSLCERLGIPTKQGAYSADIVERALAGDKKARAEHLDYGDHDIIAAEALWDVLRPWTTTGKNPAAGTVDEPGGKPRPNCHACGSENLIKRGTRVAQVFVYQRYRCKDCGAWPTDRTRLEGSEKRISTSGAA